MVASILGSKVTVNGRCIALNCLLQVCITSVLSGVLGSISTCLHSYSVFCVFSEPPLSEELQSTSAVSSPTQTGPVMYMPSAAGDSVPVSPSSPQAPDLSNVRSAVGKLLPPKYNMVDMNHELLRYECLLEKRRPIPFVFVLSRICLQSFFHRVVLQGKEKHTVSEVLKGPKAWS